MNDQIENIYNLIEQGEAEEASKAIYKYLISGESNLPAQVKSYMQSNPPEVYAADGFDCKISEDMLSDINKEFIFISVGNGKKLHIAVEHILPSSLSVKYWIEQ